MLENQFSQFGEIHLQFPIVYKSTDQIIQLHQVKIVLE